MVAFIPHALISIVWMALLFTGELLAGFTLQRGSPTFGSRLIAWGMMALGTSAAHFLTLQDPAGFRMLALIAALFLGMKAVVGVSARAAGEKALPFDRWTIFSILWAGMRPVLFEGPPTKAKPYGAMALQGSLCAFAGALLMTTTGPVWRWTDSVFLVTILFFIGSSLLVHYGFFTLAAAFWRARGFDCEPLFRNPLVAENLGDFWGKYWNLAFREMTSLAVYRPLKGRLGSVLPLFPAFVLSGLFHEVAISAPVRDGYGLPLLYFLLHGTLVGGERIGLKKGFVIQGYWGRIWTFFWLILPLPVLFHGPFLRGVIWPLIGGGR